MGQLMISPEGYIEIKRKIKDRLDETVNSFIIIGYYLKQVRDSGAYRNDGYRSMEEFAQGEYGLSAGTASRFMDINTEFSKDGNSPEIKYEYRNYAYSKLQEMLTVSPGDRELITEDATVKQIRELKAVEREEEQAGKAGEQRSLPLLQPDWQDDGVPAVALEDADPFTAVMTAFWKENTELYNKTAAGTLTPEIVAEEICPSGSRTYRSGTNMMFFYDFDRGIKLRRFENGSPVITPYSYRELLEKTMDMAVTAQQETEDDNARENTVATPQSGQPEQYTPVPGQISVSDLEDTVPAPEETEVFPDNPPAAVIDGEYREMDGGKKEDNRKAGQQAGTESTYTDTEIKNAVSYFDTEYSRMLGLGQDTAKRRNYKIALECIRKCYRAVAEHTDNGISAGKEAAIWQVAGLGDNHNAAGVIVRDGSRKGVMQMLKPAIKTGKHHYRR